ncbi:MAG: hypothetical protein Q7O66_12250 [Dehalococcoidia bacterium]|nr:hypothetical protein [Dehalococcoidia bacterium]
MERATRLPGALSHIAGDFPRLRDLVAGEPDPPGETSYLERLRGLTRDLGLEGRVNFLGFVGDDGRLVPLGDPRTMAEAQRQVVSDRETAARMVETARNQVSQRFTLDKFAEGVERAYSMVLS